MAPTDLKLAARLFSDGDFGTLFYGLLRRITENVLDGVRVVSVYDAANQGDEPARYTLVRSEDGRAFHALTDQRELLLSPDEPFSTIELSLGFPGLATATTVRFTAQTVDGESVARERRVVPNDYFGSWSVVPVFESFDTRLTEATIRLDTTPKSDRAWKRRAFRHLPLGGTDDQRTYYVPNRPQLGAPICGSTTDSTPIFLLSIDTLRYDQQRALAPLLDELGDDASVPSEPRTQGYWTAPSHASMFTGVHPSTHGYLGWDDGANTPINPNLTTMPELLHDCGYKCSGIVSHGRIRPQFGFGRGFHRFRYDPMTDWIARDNDARSTVERLVEWVTADARRGHDTFYFAHFFDPHGPYIPPVDAVDGDLDLEMVKRFRDQCRGPYTAGTDELFNPEVDVATDLADFVRDYYEASVSYTAEEIGRFVRELKRLDLFDESLVIVTGDHGEEWGESGYFGHQSLYDASIRPFMAIKPPAEATWTVPDTVDTIDFLPTVAEAVGAPVPSQCQGEPLQRPEAEKDVRTMEAFGPDWYHVAVERDGLKAIASFDGNYPERPSAEQAAGGPRHVEYHTLDDVRDGDYGGTSPTREQRRFVEDYVEEFLTTPITSQPIDSESLVTAADQESKAQLEYLGYR